MNKFNFKDYHIFYTIGILIVGFIIFMIANQAQYGSMDYKIYECAVKLFQEDKDPYNMDTLNNECTKFEAKFPWRYPPIVLPFFSLFTWMPRHVAWSIFLILSILILWRVDKKLKLPFLFILLFGMFNAALRNYSVGNMGCIDFMFLSIVTYFIFKDKYLFASIIIGVMSIFKTVPIAYCAIFIILCTKNSDKIKYISISILSLICMHLLSFIIFKNLSLSFYNLVLFGYPVVDAGGFYNPSLFALVNQFIWSKAYAIIIYFIIVLTLGIFHLKCMSKIKDKNKKYLLTILAIMCVLPELKMYTYILAVIPLYFILKDKLYIDRFWILLWCGAFPVIINYWFLLNKELYTGTAWEIFFNYCIYFSLLTTYLLINIKEVKVDAKEQKDVL